MLAVANRDRFPRRGGLLPRRAGVEPIRVMAAEHLPGSPEGWWIVQARESPASKPLANFTVAVHTRRNRGLQDHGEGFPDGFEPVALCPRGRSVIANLNEPDLDMFWIDEVEGRSSPASRLHREPGRRPGGLGLWRSQP